MARGAKQQLPSRWFGLAVSGSFRVTPYQQCKPDSNLKLSRSVTLEKEGPLFGDDHFSVAATKKKVGKRMGATEQRKSCYFGGPVMARAAKGPLILGSPCCGCNSMLLAGTKFCLPGETVNASFVSQSSEKEQARPQMSACNTKVPKQIHLNYTSRTDK